MNRSPVVAVQLLDGETAVQKLGEQLSVSFTGTTMEREVIHPLALPAEKNSTFTVVSFFWRFSYSIRKPSEIVKKLHRSNPNMSFKTILQKKNVGFKPRAVCKANSFPK